MNVFITIETLTNHPFVRLILPSTAGGYWQVVNKADDLCRWWEVLTTADNLILKQRWHSQFCLSNQNKLRVVDDLLDAAAGNTLITHDLNLARKWCAAGGVQAWWIDELGKLRDASGNDRQWLARVAWEALNELVAKPRTSSKARSRAQRP